MYVFCSDTTRMACLLLSACPECPAFLYACNYMQVHMYVYVHVCMCMSQMPEKQSRVFLHACKRLCAHATSGAYMRLCVQICHM